VLGSLEPVKMAMIVYAFTYQACLPRNLELNKIGGSRKAPESGTYNDGT